jgi:hypothetical protein
MSRPDNESTAALASVSELVSILIIINGLLSPVGRFEREVVSGEVGLRTAAITVPLSRVGYLATRPRSITGLSSIVCERERVGFCMLPLLAPEMRMVDMVCAVFA